MWILGPEEESKVLGWKSALPPPRLSVFQNVLQVTKVTVKQFADAFMVLKSKVIVVAVGGGQVDEAIQREREALPI